MVYITSNELPIETGHDCRWSVEVRPGVLKSLRMTLHLYELSDGTQGIVMRDVELPEGITVEGVTDTEGDLKLVRTGGNGAWVQFDGQDGTAYLFTPCAKNFIPGKSGVVYFASIPGKGVLRPETMHFE